jgi:hypothetical protein
MEEFEEKLRGIQTRPPSAALDRRIESALASARAATPVRRSIPLRWALAASLAMGLIGFAAGRLGEIALSGPSQTAADSLRPAARPATSSVQVKILFSEAPATNPFDCTTAVDDDPWKYVVNALPGKV